VLLNEDPKIEWSDFETAMDKNAEKKKLIFIDMYTDWCGWCKKMDQTTFKNQEVVTFMNENFHAVKMNPESSEAIVFREKLYELKDYNGKKYNELAVNLLGGKMSFPSFIILSKKEVKIGTITGYQSPSQLLSALEKYVK
jgi:thioredoxin-related protein